MKKILVIVAMMSLFSNAFAQSFIDASVGTTISPFATTMGLIEGTTVLVYKGRLPSPSFAVQARGVAGKEQLKDELTALTDDILSGAVRSIEEVRQPAMKELFAEIYDDETQMEEIHSVIKSGSEFEKIATAVAVILLAE